MARITPVHSNPIPLAQQGGKLFIGRPRVGSYRRAADRRAADLGGNEEQKVTEWVLVWDHMGAHLVSTTYLLSPHACS